MSNNDNGKKSDFRLKVGEWVLVGTLVVSISLLFIGSDRIYLFIDSFNKAERQEQAEAAAKLENLRIQAKLNAAKDAQDHLAAEQRQRQSLEEKQRQQSQLLEKMQQAQTQDREKQAKWERYFKESAACIAPKDWKKQVECADERMKAEERFEELYKSGKL